MTCKFEQTEEEKRLNKVAGWVNLALLPMNLFIQGFVFQRLWLWFAVPLGGPAIGVWHAYGLSLFVVYVTFRPKHHTVGPTSIHVLVMSLVWPPIVLGLGFLAKTLMGL